MSDAVERARHVTLLSVIAAQLGVPIGAFIHYAAKRTGPSHPVLEAHELNRLFAQIGEPAARARCLEFVRSVANEAPAPGSTAPAD